MKTLIKVRRKGASMVDATDLRTGTMYYINILMVAEKPEIQKWDNFNPYYVSTEIF